jgi:hypothetical protein
MANIDFTDPCAALAYLEEQYTKLLAGQQVQLTEFQVGTGTRRRMQFATVNAKFIQDEINRLRIECQKAKGLRSFRSCVRGG